VTGECPPGALAQRLEDPLRVERPAPSAGVQEDVVVFGVVVPAGKLAAGVDPGEVVAEVRGSEDLVAEEFRGVDAAHVQV
jgi:hypothetical protein